MVKNGLLIKQVYESFEIVFILFLCRPYATYWIYRNVFHRQFFTYYIFFVSLKFGACYTTGQWSEFRVKNATLCLCILFFRIFLLSIVIVVFFSFSFFDKVSNYRNKILTNQKTEWVIRSCKWNCMIDLSYNNYNPLKSR